MARKTSAEAASAVRLVPSTSSFDFLEGAFAAAQRARKIGLGITLFAVATLTALTMMGVQGVLAKQASRALLEQTQADNQVALTKLAKIDNAGGMGADQLTAHVNERTLALKGAIGSEIDVVAFIRALRSTAPAGVEISSITFHDAMAGVTNAESIAGTTTPPPADPNAPPAAPSDPNAASGSTQLGTVEIKGTVKSFALIGAWAQTVGTVAGMSGVNPTWTGGGDAIATTLTANISETGLTKRSRALVAGKGN